MIRSLGRVISLLLLAAMLIPTPGWTQTGCPCVGPNVGGTIELMPGTCPSAGYLGSMLIDNGLTGGDTIGIDAELSGFYLNSEAVGGTLGGTTQIWQAYLHMHILGTGTLSGFERTINVPVSGETHAAPRTFGDAVQSFDHDLINLDGELFGDPDFCLLKIHAGSDFGLPSPGHTTLTRLGPAGSDFEMDSFFDIAYTIEFQGCPGSSLEGLAGTSEHNDIFQMCDGGPTPVEETTWGRIKALYN